MANLDRSLPSGHVFPDGQEFLAFLDQMDSADPGAVAEASAEVKSGPAENQAGQPPAP